MPFKVTSRGNSILVRADFKTLEGDLGNKMREICLSSLKKEMKDIHFSFPSVTYMDSACIGALLDLLRFVSEGNKKLFFDEVSDEVRSLFKSLMLDAYIVM